MTEPTPTDPTRLPPRWVIRSVWIGHRTLVRVTGTRVGLARPTPGGRFGMLRLATVGRKTGKPRAAMLGYIEDGPNLVTPAMNGWAQPEPAWWLNLQGNPEATVELLDGPRKVTARAAIGEGNGGLEHAHLRQGRAMCRGLSCLGHSAWIRGFRLDKFTP